MPAERSGLRPRPRVGEAHAEAGGESVARIGARGFADEYLLTGNYIRIQGREFGREPGDAVAVVAIAFARVDRDDPHC
jgi:hypothetical protein